MAIGGILFWLMRPPPEVARPLPTGIAPAAVLSPRPPDPAPAPTVSASSQQPAVSVTSDPRRELLSLIHAKLDQWYAVETGDTETQDRLTKELIALLSDANAAEIGQSFSSEELNTPFGLAALGRWLDVEAMEAASWVATYPDATETQALVVARGLLRDPARLNAFCAQLPDTEWKQTFLRAAALEGLSQDPLGAINLARNMDPGAAQTDVLQTVAYDWMTRDPAAVSDWMVTVHDPILREQLLSASAKAIAVTDPDLAAGWVSAMIKSEAVAHDAALSVVATWVASDPAKVAAWVAQFPSRGSRDAAITIVARRWLESDPAAAHAWIQTLPERDDILARLAAEQAERERPPDLE